MNKGMTYVVGLAAIAMAVFAGLDYFNKGGSSSGGGSASTGGGGFGGSLGLLGGTNTGIASPVPAGAVAANGGATVAGARFDASKRPLCMFFGREWCMKVTGFPN